VRKQLPASLERKAEGHRICSLFFVALIKREVKATFNRMLKVPGLPLPGEEALELRRDCPPGCQHCAPFPSQIINEIKVRSVHFLACPNSLFIFDLGGRGWRCFLVLFFFLRGCSGSKEVAVRTV